MDECGLARSLRGELSSPTLRSTPAATRRARNEANHVRLHIAAAALDHLCNLAVEVGVPIDAGHSPLGQRRLVPILGGTVGGRLTGRVLPAPTSR
jgi:hypothetical protein